ncbi:hypothetical protein ACI796_03710 [Geodermatophilus sp. SYSU D00525]
MNGAAVTRAQVAPASGSVAVAGTPVTPCAPEAAVAFVAGRCDSELVGSLDPASRLAAVRAQRIVELRRCGQLRHAERYGWLSLTGWLLGMSATVVGRLDPASAAVVHRAGVRDVLPDPVADDPAPAVVDVAGLQLADPRDPLGYRVLQLAVAALRDGVVDVGGRRVGGGAVAASLRQRLEVTGRG